MASRLPALFGLLALALCVAAGAGCGGPLLILPGGELDGTEAAPPDDWAFTREIDTVQLETRPEDPYSVNVWATAVGSALYLHAGANRSTWVEHMEADPNVRLRVEGSIYPLRARRVEGQDEFDRFADAYEEKYGRRPRNEDVTEAYLFRLEKRP